jgi:cyclic pyranopterin monophosphate synthase
VAPPLSHLDDDGRAHMVDVTDKEATVREAVARGRVLLGPVAFPLVRDQAVKKGDVLTVAQVAGIQAAKRTAELIPLCHPLSLSSVAVDVSLDAVRESVEIEATCRTRGETGVEMEALTAVAVAALTVYDMCKAAERGIRIEAVRLVRKSGGRSGEWVGE